jgi:predicted ATPase
MLERITVSGIGPWLSQTTFNLRSLNILLGDNDVGKSSVIKAFLMLKLPDTLHFDWASGCKYSDGLMAGAGKSRLSHILQIAHSLPNGGLLLLEHPDAFLHPSLQADLADILIDLLLADDKLQIVVETHSEHFVTRVQRRIAEGKFHPSLLSVYCCLVGESGSVAVPLKINEYGDRVDWPTNVFGDLTGDLLAAAKAAFERQQ